MRGKEWVPMLLFIILVLALVIAGLVWVRPAQADTQPWPQVTRVIQPEDLDR